ncbi:MAG: class I SAM-dependent methyltransferase [Chloroflexi bacterium]|nr:class I SAM-dependent methyltransferase [Chloroflexota bacterium]
MTNQSDSTPHVDYNRIAPSFNQRYVTSPLEGVKSALLALARDLNASRILEVGCGTGHWLHQFQEASGAPEAGKSAVALYGVDLSTGMLQQALERPAPLRLACGHARRLPFADAQFDLIVCVNAMHHFGQPRAFIAEARRLLRPGGALAVIGSDPNDRRDDWYVYSYFEGTYDTDLRRFPSWGTVLDWMAAVGFARVEWRCVERIEKNWHGRDVLSDLFLRKDACSQLALLSNDAYDAGRKKIEAAVDAAEARGETLTATSVVTLGMITGRV